jgi:uncharacterized protein
MYNYVMIVRHDLEYLRKWKERGRRKPLILRGARQVGKTEIVRQLGKEFDLFVEFNFDEFPGKASLFKSGDVNQILLLIEADSGKKIVPGKTLIFFDEIQAAPYVVPLLRYFYEKVPQIHIIAAGSLLGFLLSDHNFSMPVGRVEYHFMGPLTFEEFLRGSGEDSLAEFLYSYKLEQELPESLHQKYMSFLKYYTLVGGMPEASLSWIESGDIVEVQRIHASILQTYEDDFNKYRKRINPDHLRLVMRRIPSIVGRKLRYVNLDRNISASSLSSAVGALSDAGVMSRIFHSDGNGLPLGAEISAKKYKPLFIDIGLHSTALGLRLTDVYTMDNILLINNGAIAEQFIGQHLLFNTPPWIKPELFYWHREKKGSSSEVDYLIADGPVIIPVEVKAGKTGSLRSLHTFAALKKTKFALRFNGDLPSITDVKTTIEYIGEADYKLMSLPLYMVDQVHRILDSMDIF